MAKTFLTAEWRKLVMANYVVPEELLLPYLPGGTALDLYKGRCFVSLVGFLFQETRLRGLRVPFHVQFEEVNLRFYVRYGDKRGVVFIREIVPRLALRFVANVFYGEKYRTARMRHEWKDEAGRLAVSYGWRIGGCWQEMRVVSSLDAQPVVAGSEEEFITEHYWGYTRLGNGNTSEYEVVHPRWEIYPVESFAIHVDFAHVYGTEFAVLNTTRPHNMLLAEGSEVTVRSGQRVPVHEAWSSVFSRQTD
jgi:uncharacterized protein